MIDFKENTLLESVEIRTIMHCQNYLLLNYTDIWGKKGDQDFDVMVGGLEGAENCNLVGQPVFIILFISNNAYKQKI